MAMGSTKPSTTSVQDVGAVQGQTERGTVQRGNRGVQRERPVHALFVNSSLSIENSAVVFWVAEKESISVVAASTIPPTKSPLLRRRRANAGDAGSWCAATRAVQWKHMSRNNE
jgi:hypothetical protein